MCGIGGIWRFKGKQSFADIEHARKISESLKNRGPDGNGEFIDSNSSIILIHRRLAIIDPHPRSNQPIKCRKTGNVLSFNGEIYNFKELRNELKYKYQCTFETESDSEVILHGFFYWGEKIFERLEGMFAIALWQAENKCLYLARDAFGIKPLYFSLSDQKLEFASSVSALIEHSDINDLKICHEAESLFLALGSIPDPYTMYTKFRSLNAGCYLKIESNGTHRKNQFWSLADTASRVENSQSTDCHAELINQLRIEIDDSISENLLSDVPVSTFLSAGIDSAVIATVAARTSKNLSAITIGFDQFKNSTHDEVGGATQLSIKLGINHLVSYFSNAAAETVMQDYFAHMDQPSIDGFNTFLVSKAAQKAGFKVALSGIGADELLGTYSSYSNIPRMWKSRFLVLNPFSKYLMQRFGRNLNNNYSGKVERLCNIKPNRLYSYYFAQRGIKSAKAISEYYNDSYSPEEIENIVDDYFSKVAQRYSGSNNFLKILELESNVYMRNQLLKDADWASMHHSLEVRVPFLKKKSFELAAQIYSIQQRPIGKKFLQAISPQNLPDSLFIRPKTGFSIPGSELIKSKTKVHWSRTWSLNALSQYKNKFLKNGVSGDAETLA